MVFCFLFVLVPAALAQAMPTKDEEHIFANGIPVVFKEGEDGKTNMYLASDTEFVSPVFTDVSDYIIYAGWPDGDREGDTSLTFLSGQFNNMIYGGSLMGSVTGNTNIVIKGGTFNSSLFGGGALAPLNGDTNIVFEDGVILGAIFGVGREEGADVNNAAITVSGGTVAFLHGGGWKSATNHATTMIKGGTVTESVYGGGLGPTSSVNTTMVLIEGGELKFVCGGSAQGVVGGTAQMYILGGTFSQTVFGGGGSTGVTNSTYVVIEDGNFNWVYGGGSSGPVTGGTLLIINGGTFNELVSGAGLDEAAPVAEADLVINNGIFNGNIFAGGYCSPVEGTARLTINGGMFAKAVLGGGCLDTAVVNNVEMAINGGLFDGYIYGGGYQAQVTGSVYMELNGGGFGRIYGSGQESGIAGDLEMHLKVGFYKDDVLATLNSDAAVIDGRANHFRVS